MILNNQFSLSADIISDALDAAHSILNHDWLAEEHRKRPNDPLLAHLSNVVSEGFQFGAIRTGLSDGQHPLAEAVLAGRLILEQHKKDGRLCPSILSFLLCSLLDVANARDAIGNVEGRLNLLQGPNWKPALYELLTAAAYAGQGVRCTLIPEGPTSVPDIKLDLEPSVFVECKAKLQHGEDIVDFIGKARRLALASIAAHLKKIDAGFLVRMQVSLEDGLRALPTVVEEMATRGERVRRNDDYEIEIEPFESSIIDMPHPMSAASAEFWKWAFGFDQWDEWHYVLPGGNFLFSNLSNLLVKQVQRPVLICLRAKYLADNTLDVLRTLKDACNRQLKNHRPGVIHVLINSRLFGIGEKSRLPFIANALQTATRELFRSYSRVARVVYDIVTPPISGTYSPAITRIAAASDRSSQAETIPESPAVLLL